MSGDQLNLDLILWRAREADTFGLSPATLEIIVADDVPALVAEVRRLRDPDVMLAALIQSGHLSTQTHREGDSSSVRTILHYSGSRIIDEQPT